MDLYTIINGSTGLSLGRQQADTPEDALEQWARAEGHKSLATMAVAKGDTEVRFRERIVAVRTEHPHDFGERMRRSETAT